MAADGFVEHLEIKVVGRKRRPIGARHLLGNRISSSMCLARQLDPNERPFSMLTHSSGTCQRTNPLPREKVAGMLAVSQEDSKRVD